MVAKPELAKLEPKPDDKDDVLFIKIDGMHRGYKKEFLSQNIPPMMESILICPNCTGILHGATVCVGAITCENCANPKGEKSKVTQVVNTVMGLDVKCPLLRKCEWSGKLSSAEEHLDKCLFLQLKCPLGCGQVFERAKEENHKSRECVQRKINCQHCKKPFSSQELENHSKNCDSQLVKCPIGCGRELAKKDTTAHKNTECPLVEIKCPFEKYGCKIGAIKRKVIAEHKTENVSQHLDFILERQIKLETENTNLKKELTNSKKELADTKNQLAARITTLEKGVKK